MGTERSGCETPGGWDLGFFRHWTGGEGRAGPEEFSAGCKHHETVVLERYLEAAQKVH